MEADVLDFFKRAERRNTKGAVSCRGCNQDSAAGPRLDASLNPIKCHCNSIK